MEHVDYEINDQVSTRKYHTATETKIYLVDDEDNEIAEVKLLNGLDLGDFVSIIKGGGEN